MKKHIATPHSYWLVQMLALIGCILTTSWLQAQTLCSDDPTPINTPGYSLNTDLSGSTPIQNFAEFNGAYFDLDFFLTDTAELGTGIRVRNQASIGPDGKYINVRAKKTDFPNGATAVYIMSFNQEVKNLKFKWGGLDHNDQVQINAFLYGEIVTIDETNLTDVNIGAANITISGNSVISTSLAANAPNNSFQFSITEPVDSIVVTTGKAIGSSDNITLQLYEISYCLEDTDFDEISNQIDLDDDNDGIPDADEDGGTGFAPQGDADGDGIINIRDQSDATSGFPSFVDVNTDGLNDKYDKDVDGVPDYLDLDSDNDGIPDIIEAGGIDTDGDGLVDFPDIGDPTSMVDVDGDGLDDALDNINSGAPSGEVTSGTPLENRDQDGDGLADALDLDSDNDGIPDLVEIGGIDESDPDGLVDESTDDDKDGFADIYDPDDDGTFGIDSGEDTNPLVKTNSSGIFLNGADGSSLDSDNDGIYDHLDLDSDNDGIPDIIEVGGSSPNDDGMVDTAASPWDADEDGLADIYDENSIGTALIITGEDDNNDGKQNDGNPFLAGDENNVNGDNDIYPNYLDLDSDNDGITDVVENAAGNVEADNGGAGALSGKVHNFTDSGASDGWNDSSTTSTQDRDSDKIPDFLDADSDNDGILDYLEGVCSTCPTFTAPTGSDSNSNGVLDMYENLTAANANGGSNMGTTPNIDDDSGNTTPDYLDIDTDADGTADWSEGNDQNNDGQAIDDLMILVTNYEANTSNGYYDNSVDTDNDNIPDWADNQPTVSGYIERNRPPFLNRSSSFWHDDNKNGLVDLFEPTQGGTSAPTPDHNSSDDLDWRDQSSQAALPVELATFQGIENNCKVELIWTTSSEVNFDYFELEWSRDGQTFSPKGSVQSFGNHRGATYGLTDKIPAKYNYYRLKIIDFDGSFEYSDLIYIELSCMDALHSMKVYPNPAHSGAEVLVEFNASGDDEQLFLTDQNGKIIQQFYFETNFGLHQQFLILPNLAAGIYFLQLAGQTTAQRIIIQE